MVNIKIFESENITISDAIFKTPTNKLPIAFFMNKQLGRVCISIADIDVTTAIKLCPTLQYMLGFSMEEGVVKNIKRKENIAKYLADLNGIISALYVYTDTVHPQIVGDSLCNLIRVCPINTSGLCYGQMITNISHTPHYVPVVSKAISTIDISINTDQDTPLRLNFGKSICKLHFVQKTHRLI